MVESTSKIKDINISTTLRNWLLRTTAANRTRAVQSSFLGISTDLGRNRSQNQDRAIVVYYRTKEDSTLLLLLADGMGGMKGGSECAATCLSSMVESFFLNIEMENNQRLLEMASDANKNVFELFNGEGGTTLSAISITRSQPPAALNVGDSRIYAIKEREIRQLSIDDTVAGRFSKAQDLNIPTNALLQFIGIGDDIELKTIPVHPYTDEFSFLLTTDGAHFPGDNIIQKLQNNAESPEIFSRRLIETAKWLGSTDNLTAITTRKLNDTMRTFDEQLEQKLMYIWDAYGDLSIFIPRPDIKENLDEKTSRKEIDSRKSRPRRTSKSKTKNEQKKTEQEDRTRKSVPQIDIFSSKNEKE